jgi:hypothetical protein
LPGAKYLVLLVVLAVGGLAALSCGDDKKETQPSVRLNELQFIGTHNSYHIQPPKEGIDAIALFDPDFARSIEFTHPPLRSQFDSGIRQIELDAYYDPQGGRFAKRMYADMLGIPGAAEGLENLRDPGFKVLHSPEADFFSTCWTLKSCLTEILAWSDANPAHLPITVFIEPKDEPTDDPLNIGIVQPLLFDATAVFALEAEILAVFDRDRLVTPDSVRGDAKTLQEAILSAGWPAVENTLGKVMFVLMDETTKRAAYTAAAPALEGRVMFTTSSEGQPDAAVVKIDDVRGAEETVQRLVRAGYIVRVMADAESVEVRANDTGRRDASFRAGAHYVSTDFPKSIGVAETTGYVVRFPDGSLVRCNPVTASAACTAKLSPLVRR